MSIRELHFLCKQGEGFRRLNENEFESGSWKVSDDVVRQSVGKRIYLHEKQKEAAWHGGRIVGWRHSKAGDWRSSTAGDGRKVFRYVVEGDFRKVCRKGWGREKAIIWGGPPVDLGEELAAVPVDAQSYGGV